MVEENKGGNMLRNFHNGTIFRVNRKMHQKRILVEFRKNLESGPTFPLII